MNLVSKYTSLVKFSHTVFAMPFALMSYLYAVTESGAGIDGLLLVKIILAMIFARNTAMGFNRYADRKIDSKNERTASREIPSGVITPQHALWFVVANALLFVVVALWINPLAFYLSPVALLVLVGYSYTKRFTAWCHVVLGVALGIAPIGACVAVTGAISIYSLLLAGVVITWVSGFDIIYALQDTAFDKEQGLHSVPARFGVKGAIVLSIVLHLITIYAVVVWGMLYGDNVMYRIGAGLFIVLLIWQHLLVTPKNLSRIGLAFGTVNGVASLCYGTCAIIGMFF